MNELRGCLYNSPGYTGSVNNIYIMTILYSQLSPFNNKNKQFFQGPVLYAREKKLLGVQIFHQLGPLGRVGLVVAKSVCVLFVCLSPSHAIFFEASHLPSGHMIISRPLIGPQVK